MRLPRSPHPLGLSGWRVATTMCGSATSELGLSFPLMEFSKTFEACRTRRPRRGCTVDGARAGRSSGSPCRGDVPLRVGRALAPPAAAPASIFLPSPRSFACCHSRSVIRVGSTACCARVRWYFPCGDRATGVGAESQLVVDDSASGNIVPCQHAFRCDAPERRPGLAWKFPLKRNSGEVQPAGVQAGPAAGAKTGVVVTVFRV